MSDKRTALVTETLSRLDSIAIARALAEVDVVILEIQEPSPPELEAVFTELSEEFNPASGINTKSKRRQLKDRNRDKRSRGVR